MRSNESYLDAISYQNGNNQKLSYDLWHHATLASYFKALSKHATKLPVTIIRLSDHNFNVDSHAFTELIDLLDTLPVQLKRSLTDQINFHIDQLDDDTIKLTLTGSFGYYLQTLMTLASEDEIKQNIDTLLTLRAKLSVLASRQSKLLSDDKIVDDYDNEPEPEPESEPDDDVETNDSDFDYRHKVSDNTDIIKSDDQQSDNQPSEQAATETSVYNDSNGSDALANGSNASATTTENTEHAVSDTPVTEDNSSESSVENNANDNTMETMPASSPNQASESAMATTESNTTAPESEQNNTNTTEANDDTDDEFADLYDDDNQQMPQQQTTTQKTTNNNAMLNDALVNSIQNNSDGAILDDSPVDFHDAVNQLSGVVGSALSSAPAQSATSQPSESALDKFYQEQDKELAMNLGSVR